MARQLQITWASSLFRTLPQAPPVTDWLVRELQQLAEQQYEVKVRVSVAAAAGMGADDMASPLASQVEAVAERD